MLLVSPQRRTPRFPSSRQTRGVLCLQAQAAPQTVVQLASSLGEMANCRPGLSDNDVVPVPAELTFEQRRTRRTCHKGTFSKWTRFAHLAVAGGTRSSSLTEAGSAALSRPRSFTLGRSALLRGGGQRLQV